MNKWLAIPVIAVLVVGLIVGGYFLSRQAAKLGEAESEIVALEGDVSALEVNVTTLAGDITALAGNVSTLETELAESAATAATLAADLGTANSTVSNLRSDLSTQQMINLSLSSGLKMVKDPRHFSSLTELTDWLHDDDTDTRYASDTMAEKACILQVSALRDGYLLPAFIFEDGDGRNLAAIEDELWGVRPDDDDTYFITYIEPLPSRPLPLD